MREQQREKSKLIHKLQLSSITGIFVIVAAIVFMIFGFLPANSIIITILGLIAIACIACILATPWIERLQHGDFNKKVCISFISIIAVCMLLWLVCWLLTMIVYITKSTYSAFLFNLVRFSLIITIQFMVSSTIAYVLMKYKKTMILFQVITYFSNLFIDFYATYLILCLNLVGGSVKFPGASIIFSKFMIALLVIAFLYVIISNAVIKSQEKRRSERVNEEYVVGGLVAQGDIQQQPASEEETLESKLKRLKNMKEEGLITEEEYEKKKADMMKDF